MASSVGRTILGRYLKAVWRLFFWVKEWLEKVQLKMTLAVFFRCVTHGVLEKVQKFWVTFYPLVICYIAIENSHWNSGFSHEQMVIFHSYVNVYQRVEVSSIWNTCTSWGLLEHGDLEASNSSGEIPNTRPGERTNILPWKDPPCYENGKITTISTGPFSIAMFTRG